MEVKKGYKQTEIGIIPEDWEVDLLVNNVTKVGSGITPRGGEKVYKKEGIPFIRSQNIGWGKLLLDDVVYIDSITHSSFKETEIKLYDILLNITGASIGRCAIADEKIKNGNVNQHVCIIRTVKEKINPFYLGYLLLSQSGQSQIDSFQAGGNRQGLNFEQIKSFKIHIPSLHEQTAITNALSDIDALIESLEKVITKKRNIKQGAMQQLLTGKKRLPGFGGDGISRKGYKQTEIGIIPEEWKVKTLDDLFCVSGGFPIPREKLSDNGFCYLHYGDIHKSERTFIDVTKDFFRIPKLKIPIGKIHAKSLLKDGDIVFVDASEDEEGASKHIVIRNSKNISFISGLHTIVLKSKDQTLNNKYKQFCFKSQDIKNQFYYFATGTKVFGISKSNIKKIQIPLPALCEQTAIAEVLSDMDSEIEALEKKLNKYKKVKQGMMQELLTGKKRLI